jgi:hypothetical protein
VLPEEVAKCLKGSAQFKERTIEELTRLLEDMRRKGTGPAWLKLARRVTYHVQDVLEWAKQQGLNSGYVMRPAIAEVIVQPPKPPFVHPPEFVELAERSRQRAAREVRDAPARPEAPHSERNAGRPTRRLTSIPSLVTIKPYKNFLSESGLRKLVKNADANGLGDAIIRGDWGNTYTIDLNKFDEWLLQHPEVTARTIRRRGRTRRAARGGRR